MQRGLSGSTVLVTGGSRGIGAAVVEAVHAAGSNVFFTYCHARAAAEALCARLDPQRVACDRWDAADSSAHASLIARVITRFGSIDTLVNNAAIYADNPFDGDDYEAWRAGWRSTFAANVFGVADLTFLALRAMRSNAAGGDAIRGRIINVTSRAAHRGELTFPDYGASKAALGNFTKSLARACAPGGIAAFSVAPGFIHTEMAADAIASNGDAIRAEIPGGRIGMPQDVARIIAFLASGGADYATGTTIDVNGASYVR